MAPTGSVQYTVAPAGSPQYTVAPAGALKYTVAPAGSLQYTVDNAGSLQYTVAFAGAELGRRHHKQPEGGGQPPGPGQGGHSLPLPSAFFS